MLDGIKFVERVAEVSKRLTEKQRLYATYIANPEWGNVVLVEVKPNNNSDSDKIGSQLVSIVPQSLDHMKRLFKKDGLDDYKPLSDSEIQSLEDDGIIILTDK